LSLARNFDKNGTSLQQPRKKQMNTRSLAVIFCLMVICVSPVCYAQKATGHIDIIPSMRPFVAEEYSFSASAERGDVDGQFEFHFVFDGASAMVHGSVDCIVVVGNHARIGGTVRHTSSEDLFPVGSHFIWNVTDNDTKDDGDKDKNPDTGSPLLGLPQSIPPDAFCLAGGFISEFPTQRGNVEVKPEH
jgi:hypothetical protein